MYEYKDIHKEENDRKGVVIYILTSAIIEI